MTKIYSMRKTWLAVLALATATVASAGVLTPQDALTRATLASQRVLKTAQAKQTLVYTENDKNAEPAVYVFNAEGNKGYTVVSADDATVALLGYADEGSFDLENAPENFKAWIAEYANQIQYARERGYEAAPVVSASPKAAIAPYLKTRWGQSAPFNNLCPAIGDTEHAPSGCVATALAQVMNYHQYPAKGKGSITYTYQDVDLVEHTFSMDFSSVTFDWANMLDVYTSTATDAQKNAVATLMKACGYAVEMQYDEDSSGATSYDCVQALIDNFSYDKGAYYYQRDYYMQDEWDELLYNQLVNFGPVYYKGTNSSGGGHAFVCDGYRDGLYHFNWGWSGTSNGYFVLSALEPEVQGIGGSNEGYNYTQAIIGDVTKNQITTTPRVNAICNNFFIEESSTTLGGTFSATGRFTSYTYGGLTGTYCAKLVNVSTNATYYAQGNRSPKDQKMGYGWTGCTFTLPSSLPSGTYKVTPVISVGTEYIDVPVPYSKCRYAMMTVSGNTVTIESSGVPKISATTPEMLISKIYKKNYFGLNTKITNNGESDYNGELYAILLDDDGYVKASSVRQICSFKKGETVDLRFVSMFKTGTVDKTYKLRLAVPTANPNETYDYISDPIDVEFVDRPSVCAYFYNNYDVIDLKLTNAKGEEYPKVYLQGEENPKCFRYEVPSMDELYVSFYAYINKNKSEMPYTYPFNMFIYESGSVDATGKVTCGSQIDRNYTDKYFIEPTTSSDDKTHVFEHFNTEKCEYDKDYAFRFTWRNSTDDGWSFNSTNSARVFRFVDQSGINDVNVDDATVVATEVYNLSGVKVSQDNITPGVYVVVKAYSNGVKKSEKAAIR